jgi:hypothetical protein
MLCVLLLLSVCVLFCCRSDVYIFWMSLVSCALVAVVCGHPTHDFKIILTTVGLGSFRRINFCTYTPCMHETLNTVLQFILDDAPLWSKYVVTICENID